MKEIDKIIYRGNDTYTRLYRGSVLEYERKIDYLSFTALEDSTIGTEITGTISPTPNVEYSRDKTTWSDLTTTTVSLTAGDTIYVRGNNPNSFSLNSTNYISFVMTGSVNAGGDISTLINRIGGVTEIPSAYYFRSLFRNLTALKKAPKMNFTIIKPSCFLSMFYSNKNLTDISDIQLPATTLATGCYTAMFSSCTSITKAPELPALVLADGCYQNMFYNCTSINYIKCLAGNISATDCTTKWLYNAPATGTFVKPAQMTNWTTGDSGIPTGWEIINV